MSSTILIGMWSVKVVVSSSNVLLRKFSFGVSISDTVGISLVLILLVSGFTIEGDLAGTGNLLGRGGLVDSLPLVLGISDTEIHELLNGLGDLLTVEYLQFCVLSTGTKDVFASVQYSLIVC